MAIVTAIGANGAIVIPFKLSAAASIAQQLTSPIPSTVSPRLSASDAEALVAQRLTELGRDRDVVTHDAMTALLGCADSGAALRSVLTGAMFLASTEDAPRVDASHVARAAMPRRVPDTSVLG